MDCVKCWVSCKVLIVWYLKYINFFEINGKFGRYMLLIFNLFYWMIVGREK